MKTLTCIIGLFFAHSIAIYGQEGNYHNYPDGIYDDKEDFLRGKPSEDIPYYIDYIGLSKKKEAQGMRSDKCFFISKSKGTRVSKKFAIVHDGYIYFGVHEITKNLSKKDRVQSIDNPKAYIRVLSHGKENYYLEAVSANGWGKGAGAGVGGLFGAAIMSSTDKLTGIVYNLKSGNFNIFRNCKDFNNYLQNNHPEYNHKCQKKKLDIKKVRDLLNVILN